MSSGRDPEDLAGKNICCCNCLIKIGVVKFLFSGNIFRTAVRTKQIRDPKKNTLIYLTLFGSRERHLGTWRIINFVPFSH
jgi:hypothetical protein